MWNSTKSGLYDKERKYLQQLIKARDSWSQASLLLKLKGFSRPPVQTSQEQFLNVLDDAISFYLLPVCQIEAKIRNAAHQW